MTILLTFCVIVSFPFTATVLLVSTLREPAPAWDIVGGPVSGQCPNPRCDSFGCALHDR